MLLPSVIITVGLILQPTAWQARHASAEHRHEHARLSSIDDALASASPSVALVLPPPQSSSSSVAEAAAASGSAVCIEAQGEVFLLSSLHVVGDADTHEVALPEDGHKARHVAKVVGRAPAVDLALMSLPEGVAPPPVLPLGEGASLDMGDFAIALSCTGRALGIVCSKTTMPSLASGADANGAERSEAPPGTAEAAMAEAELAAEEEALERGEQPFIVVDAPSVEGVVGGPLLSADGALVGLTTLVMSAGAESTRYYAVSAERCARAIDAMLERRSLGERVKGARVVLFNDSINKRENVQAVLSKAGLSEAASSLAMLSAHKTGRGVIGYFEDPEEAKALVYKIAELGRELPSALIVAAETCSFYKQAESASEAKPSKEIA